MIKDTFWEDVLVLLMRSRGLCPFEIVTSSNYLMFQEVAA